MFLCFLLTCSLYKRGNGISMTISISVLFILVQQKPKYLPVDIITDAIGIESFRGGGLVIHTKTIDSNIHANRKLED